MKEAIKNLAERIEKTISVIQTEEATKNAYIMPFLQLLGYDVFNPLEVVPEFTADVGSKNGEKVDFEAVAKVYLKEVEYLLLAPVDDDSDDIYVFRVDEVDGKEELNLVEDDKEFLEVKKEYKKLLY